MLKIVRVISDKKYAVLDTDDGVVEDVSVEELLTCMGTGILIEGCHYTEDGLFVDIDKACYSRSLVELPEVWRVVSGFKAARRYGATWYEVSNLGRVRCITFKQSATFYAVRRERKRGGRYVTLDNKEYFVHDLVACAFIPNKAGRPYVLHLDGNNQNNRLDNLAWSDSKRIRKYSDPARGTPVDWASFSVSFTSKRAYAEDAGTPTKPKSSKVREPDKAKPKLSKPKLSSSEAKSTKSSKSESKSRKRDIKSGSGVHSVPKQNTVFSPECICFNSFLPSEERFIILGVDGEAYRVFDESAGREVSMTAEELLIYKASGHEVKSCFYSQNGLTIILPDSQLREEKLEIWKRVSYSGYKSFIAYEVSNLGNVRRNDPVLGVSNVLKRMSADDRLFVHLSFVRSGRPVVVDVAELVAKAFIPNPNNLKTIIHLDDSLSNNSAGNLAWSDTDDSIASEIPADILTVNCYASDMRLLTRYTSVSEAARVLDHSYSEIMRHCNLRLTLDHNGTCLVLRYAHDDELCELSQDMRYSKLRQRIIRQYGSNGKLVSEYSSVRVASEKNQDIDKTSIGNVCARRGRNVSAAGYVWRYANDDEFFTMTESERISALPLNHVRQYSTKGKFINEYRSAVVAERETGVSASAIHACCARGTKISGGFVWRYSRDDELRELSVSERLVLVSPQTVRQYTKFGKWVGEFASITEASKKTGLGRYAIYSCAARREGYVSGAGYVWRYSTDDELWELSETERMELLGFSCIRQYNIDGELVGEYDTVSEASSTTGVSRVGIDRSKSRQDSGCDGGFVWRMTTDDELYDMSIEDRKALFALSAVRQYKRSGELVEEFRSVHEASLKTGIDGSILAKSCKGQHNFQAVGGFLWRYANNDEFHKGEGVATDEDESNESVHSES